MLVRETIHHGDYRFTREVEVAATWVGFVELLLSSPYRGGQTVEGLAGNRFAAATFAELLTTGVGERGWSRFEVIG